MMLFVNGVSGGVRCLNVGYWVKSHESAFELLTQLVASEWILEQAIIVDGSNRMSMPVEVFDGQPILVHIRALQQEWQQLLTVQPSLTGPSTNQQLKEWYSQLDDYYQEQINHLQKMVLCLEYRLIKTISRREEPLTLRIRGQYEQLLTSTKRMIKQTQVSRRKNRKRLKAME